MVDLHPSAHLDEGATVGEGTKLWHGSHVMATAKIGSNCVLGQNVFVGNRVTIGNNVKIQNNINVYEGVTVEDDVFLGPSMTFTNVINPRSTVERKEEFKETIIEKGSSIGANACIVCGIKIGMYSFVGAGAVVTKNVLPFELVVGNPAKPIGWMSKRGIRLSFNNQGEATCPESNEVYLHNNGKVEIVE
jgi:UDP-2-acetamido-3-amino-2,3-dideoxy-glucuronate N-acetyltransferase